MEYQFVREEKENKLLEQLKSRGITQDLPQHTTDFWGNPANNYGFGTTDIAANIENMQNNTTPIPMATPTPQQKNNMLPNNPVAQQNPLQQVVGAIGDMVGNYVDMKRDNTVKGDDYFHCKANYEAAQRGAIGETVAEKLGNTKENFDFWDNQLRKRLSYMDAYKDRLHDRTINQIGRQKAKSGLYRNSREACYPYRVEGINEKY